MFNRNRIKFFLLVGLTTGLVALAGGWALTHEDHWYPSRWGADDQRGAANRITPAKILEAASLIKEGKIYQLGRVYEAGMPVFGTRHYSLRIPVMSGAPG